MTSYRSIIDVTGGDNSMAFQRQGGGQGGFNRQMFDVTCSDCGTETQVPFKPDGDRPVYCRDCYQKHKPARDSYGGRE
jgi:CxxC-x17-CxxC domain-containing protein